MTTYRVYLETTVSTAVEVEADDIDAAIEKALEADMPWLCHQCSSQDNSDGDCLEMSDVWDVVDDDGTPMVEEI